MIATPTNQHEDELGIRYEQLFEQIRMFAQRKGIGKSRGLGSTLRAEDPNDFAQECLIEYNESARRKGFQKVQIRLIWRIAKQRMIDANRISSRFPRRDDFAVAMEEAFDLNESPSTESMPRSLPSSITALSEKVNDILRLKYVACYSIDEIARTMQMKPSGINAAVARARKRLLSIGLEHDRPNHSFSVSKSSKEPK